MSIAKPFTFVANTYAKASEVNADFDTVYAQVNTNISNIAQNATDISNLNSNKANINGNSTQRFAVAAPTGSNDAVNKSYLMSTISNSLDYISGLVITKDNDNTIIVSAGTCYDSGKTVLLKLNNDTSKTNNTQTAGATYYVYITSANASGTPVDITISQDSVNPGTTKYRKIGYYKAVIGKSTEAYIVSGSTPLTSGWLSATDGGYALTPDTDTYYVVKTAGEYYNKIYRWNGSAYSEVSEISSTIGDIYCYGVKSDIPQPQSVLIKTYLDDSDWYRIYSPDSTGYSWCEQGGKYTRTSTGEMAINYTKDNFNALYINAIFQANNVDTTTYPARLKTTPTTSGFVLAGNSDSIDNFPYVIWEAKGYLLS